MSQVGPRHFKFLLRLFVEAHRADPLYWPWKVSFQGWSGGVSPWRYVSTLSERRKSEGAGEEEDDEAKIQGKQLQKRYFRPVPHRPRKGNRRNQGSAGRLLVDKLPGVREAPHNGQLPFAYLTRGPG